MGNLIFWVIWINAELLPRYSNPNRNILAKPTKNLVVTMKLTLDNRHEGTLETTPTCTHSQVPLTHAPTHIIQLNSNLIYVLDTYSYIKAHTNNVKLTNYDHTEVDTFYTFNINTLFYPLLTHSRQLTNKTNTLQCSHVDDTTAQTR